MYHSMQYNIGTLYLLRNELHLAISYINKAKEYFESMQNYSELATLYISLAEAHEKSGDEIVAQKYMNFVEDSLLSHITNSEIEASTRTNLASYYEKKNNFAKAHAHLKIASTLKDSLTSANDAWRVNNLEKIYDNEQKLRENSLIIKEMQLEKMKTDRSITFIVTTLGSLIVFIIFLYIRSQLQNKLHRSNTQLAEQQLALQEKEKELQQIKSI